MKIAEALELVEEKIQKACERSGRKREDIRLMGVSKFHPETDLVKAYNAGLRLFGESRVQEAASKIPGVISQCPDCEFHLIGSLQRNKVKTSLTLFECIQSVDREELVEELIKRSSAQNTSLKLLLELHTGEESKSGFQDLDALYKAVDLILPCKTLQIQGLMTMAPYTRDQGPIRNSFRALNKARNFLMQRYPEQNWSMLSMGMSNDYEIAIEEGSTLLRIGTAIFGAPSHA